MKYNLPPDSTILKFVVVNCCAAPAVSEAAVPDTFVIVPDEGVPNAPPFTTGAPAEPTLTAKAVATPVPRPEIPVDTGRPVQLVSVPEDGVPKAGVTNVGLVAKTKAPEPVSPVTAAAKFALDGVPKKVATPVPSPEIPVATGSPVAFVRVPEEGVPKAPPFVTKAPEDPTLTAKAVATLEPKPETPVEIGRPVQLVSVPDAGVPNAGVTKVGLLANTSAPVPVSSVTAEAKFALDGVAKNVATPVPRPDTPVEIGKPVAFVRVPEEGVPNAGVTKVGLLANTKAPVPVSSETAAAKLALEGEIGRAHV